jgi:GT2 family glycosyltransferase
VTTVSVVVVGYGDESHLSECLRAIRADLREGDDVVLVDNGITSASPLPADIPVVTASRNDGFAAGCHLGADATTGDLLVFVNSDAIVDPGALDALREALSADDVGLVTGLVVMLDDAGVVNAAGNPVHFLGISWAGGYGERVSECTTPRDVASVSGALFAVRRQVWERLGGLDKAYFLYHEDADLSLRTHLTGLRVVYCPSAVARHAYSFGKNPQKHYLLERNRLVTLLTTYPAPLLVRVLPALLLTEPLILALAATQGWGTAKLRAWAWLVGNSKLLLARRHRVQASAVVPWRELAMTLSARIDHGPAEAPPAMDLLNALLNAYWRSLGLSKGGNPDG